MKHIVIADEHKTRLTRLQYALEHMQAMKQRLAAELAHVQAGIAHIESEGARLHNELVYTLQHLYGVDAASSDWELDAERGVITVPDGPADEGSAPADPGLPDPQDSASAEIAREGN